MHYHTVAAPEAHIFRVLHTSEDSTQSLGFFGLEGKDWKLEKGLEVGSQQREACLKKWGGF